MASSLGQTLCFNVIKVPKRVAHGCWTGNTRSGVFARWIGIVALLGAVTFFIAFFTLIDGPTEDSVFGYGFPYWLPCARDLVHHYEHCERPRVGGHCPRIGRDRGRLVDDARGERETPNSVGRFAPPGPRREDHPPGGRPSTLSRVHLSQVLWGR